MTPTIRPTEPTLGASSEPYAPTATATTPLMSNGSAVCSSKREAQTLSYPLSSTNWPANRWPSSCSTVLTGYLRRRRHSCENFSARQYYFCALPPCTRNRLRPSEVQEERQLRLLMIRQILLYYPMEPLHLSGTALLGIGGRGTSQARRLQQKPHLPRLTQRYQLPQRRTARLPPRRLRFGYPTGRISIMGPLRPQPPLFLRCCPQVASPETWPKVPPS